MADNERKDELDAVLPDGAAQDGAEQEQTYTLDEQYAGQEPAGDALDATEDSEGKKARHGLDMAAALSSVKGFGAHAAEGLRRQMHAAGGKLQEMKDKKAHAREEDAALYEDEPEDEPAGKKPSKRKKKKAKALLPIDPTDREPPTVGRDLKPDQMLVYDSELDEVDYTDPEDLPEMRDYLPIRFRRYGRSGLGGGILYALFVISVSIVLACFAWMCAVDVLALNKDMVSAPVTILPYEPTGDMPVTVEKENDDGEIEEIPIQVDIDQVADALKAGGIIEYKWLFKIFSKFSDANIKIDPGTYDLNTSYDYRALVTKMQFGSDNQEVTRVTFPEGFTMEQIFTLLEENQVSHKEDLYEAAANYDFEYDFLEGIPLGDASRLEGFLFPDTYEFYQGEPAETSIKRFLNNTENKLTESILKGFESHDLTVREGVIMASLIEKEAGATEGERENMASVIYNRLRDGWNLQLDSTVNYAKGTNTLDLTIADTQFESPYNTYLHEGLPPGAICNPGAAALQAVAKPAKTKYYFWYSVDGVSTFFTNKGDFDAFANSH